MARKRTRAAKGKTECKLPPELQEEISKAKEEGGKKRDVVESAELRHRHSINAKRLLQACAEFSRLEEKSLRIERARLGKSTDWRACNEEFCRRWISLWVESKDPVCATLGIEHVRELQPKTAAARAAHRLYLDVLGLGDASATEDSVLPLLEEAREQLGEDRFELGGVFEELALRVKREPSAAQMTSEGLHIEETNSVAEIHSRLQYHGLSKDQYRLLMALVRQHPQWIKKAELVSLLNRSESAIEKDARILREWSKPKALVESSQKGYRATDVGMKFTKYVP